MKIQTTTWALAICFSLVACTHRNDIDEPLPQPEAEGAICLSAGSSAASRSVTMLKDTYTDFAVLAKKTMPNGSKELVMASAEGKPYKVTYVDGDAAWNYVFGNQYLKYWDQSAREYSFVAFAPYSTVPTIEEDRSITINGIEGGQSVTDWLISDYRRENQPSNAVDTDMLKPKESIAQPQGLTDVVPLIFHHILSQVQFKVYSPYGEIRNVSDVEIRLIDGAQICAKADYNTLKGITSITESTEEIYAGLSQEANRKEAYTTENALTLCAMPEIPQQLPENCRVHVSVTIDGVAYAADLNFYEAAQQWEADKAYIYYLRVTLATGDLILVNVEVEDWIPGGESEEQKQTNW